MASHIGEDAVHRLEFAGVRLPRDFRPVAHQDHAVIVLDPAAHGAGNADVRSRQPRRQVVTSRVRRIVSRFVLARRLTWCRRRRRGDLRFDRLDNPIASGCGEVRRHSTGQGRVEDGQHEFLYGRAISPYFDLQAGLRTDPDSGTTRDWAAFGFRGLAPYFFDLEATGYVSDQGHPAARIRASYDVLITQRLILQPEAKLWPSDHPENRAPPPAQRLVKNCDAPRRAFLSRGILSWTGRCCGRTCCSVSVSSSPVHCRPSCWIPSGRHSAPLHVAGLGEFMPMPISVPDVVCAVGRLLESGAMDI